SCFAIAIPASFLSPIYSVNRRSGHRRLPGVRTHYAAKSVTKVLEDGSKPDPIGAPEIVLVVVNPGTAPQRAEDVFVGRFIFRVRHLRLTTAIEIFIVVVQTPLPDIACHVHNAFWRGELRVVPLYRGRTARIIEPIFGTPEFADVEIVPPGELSAVR